MTKPAKKKRDKSAKTPARSTRSNVGADPEMQFYQLDELGRAPEANDFVAAHNRPPRNTTTPKTVTKQDLKENAPQSIMRNANASHSS